MRIILSIPRRSTLTSELSIERENFINDREENTRTRDELEGLRSKCYKEVLKISTRAKGISRFEVMLKELSSSKEEAVNAPNGQAKITFLTSQVRSFRTSMDPATAEIDILQNEERILETRMTKAGERIEELNRWEISKRNHAGMSSGVLDLKPRQAQ